MTMGMLVGYVLLIPSRVKLEGRNRDLTIK